MPALLKFTQDTNEGGDGEALVGEVGTEVLVENVDDTDVASWQIDLLFAPPLSALSPASPFADWDGLGSHEVTQTAFTPDVAGSYRFRLRVWTVASFVGNPADTDIRVFSVPLENGLIIPPAQIWPLPLPDPQSDEDGAKPNEMNFGGQVGGWAGSAAGDGLLDDALRRLDPVAVQITAVEGDVAALEASVAGLTTVVNNLNAQIEKAVGVAGFETTNQEGPVSIGTIFLDPTAFPGRTFFFEAMLSTTSGSALASIRLYNLDDGEVLTGSLLTSSSLAGARVASSTFTVGATAGQLKPSFKKYDVQLFRNGGAPTDFVSCRLAQISIQV